MALGNDNFTLLRFMAATLVIYGHCWALGNSIGVVEWLSASWAVFSGTVAVNAFFFVSGFLVTSSYARRDSFRTFVRARLLRIYPGLVACALFCAVVLGASVTTLPARAYFWTPGLYSFVIRNVSLLWLQADLPGVFETNRYGAAVNGSLWTLPAEMQMYAYVALLGALGTLRSKARFAVAMATLIVLGTVARDRVSLVSLPDYYGFAAFFAAGAACWMFRDRVPVSGGVLVALIGLSVMTPYGPFYALAFGATTAYFCLWFVFVPRLGELRVGDYSYGLYLYGFPMQQLVAWRSPEMGPWALFFVSFPLAFVLAVVSWHYVEKPALAHK